MGEKLNFTRQMDVEAIIQLCYVHDLSIMWRKMSLQVLLVDI